MAKKSDFDDLFELGSIDEQEEVVEDIPEEECEVFIGDGKWGEALFDVETQEEDEE